MDTNSCIGKTGKPIENLYEFLFTVIFGKSESPSPKSTSQANMSPRSNRFWKVIRNFRNHKNNVVLHDPSNVMIIINNMFLSRPRNYNKVNTDIFHFMQVQT